VTGSNRFSIKKSPKFQRSFKVCAKKHGKDFLDWIIRIVEDLAENPYPKDSRQESAPKKAQLGDWTFHKLALSFAKGDSGQIRLMYIVNPVSYQISLVWIYTHKDIAKRPRDRDITSALKECLYLTTEES
jgi:mRNA-degrading endonuclease RelE of RelBE toxin-antitoxin system